MIGKKPSPVIGNLITGKLGSGNKSAGAGPTSPTSPLEFKIHSPRGLRTYDVGTGVGLGILAALEKSGPEIPTKNSFCCRNFNRSDPIPVSAASSNYNRGGILKDVGNDGSDSFEEEFTYVTRRNQNKGSTRVYRDGYEYSGKESRVSRKNKGGGGGGCIFYITPARFCDSSTPCHGTDFLSSCNLCKKKLHGKDIYMYRGEKAFCSKECRYRQIMKDEEEQQHKEKCSSEASSRSSSSSSSSSNIDVSISISPCKNGNMLFSTGIFAI